MLSPSGWGCAEHGSRTSPGDRTTPTTMYRNGPGPRRSPTAPSRSPGASWDGCCVSVGSQGTPRPPRAGLAKWPAGDRRTRPPHARAGRCGERVRRRRGLRIDGDGRDGGAHRRRRTGAGRRGRPGGGAPGELDLPRSGPPGVPPHRRPGGHDPAGRTGHSAAEPRQRRARGHPLGGVGGGGRRRGRGEAVGAGPREVRTPRDRDPSAGRGPRSPPFPVGTAARARRSGPPAVGPGAAVRHGRQRPTCRRRTDDPRAAGGDR